LSIYIVKETVKKGKKKVYLTVSVFSVSIEITMLG
jgi:hypothetical protein